MSGDDLIKRARELREAHQHDEAIRVYEEASAIVPGDPALCDLVELYVETKQTSKAVSFTTQFAFELARQDEPALTSDEKGQAYDRLLTALSRSSPHYRGRIALEVGSALFFIYAIATALPEDPLRISERAKGQAAQLGYDGPRIKAERLFDRVVELWDTPESPEFDAALDALTEYAQEEYPGAWYNVGRARAVVSCDWSEEEECYERMPETDPMYVTAMADLAWDYEESKFYWNALEFYGRAAATDELQQGSDDAEAPGEFAVDIARCKVKGFIYDLKEVGYDESRVEAALDQIATAFWTLQGVEQPASETSSPESEDNARFVAQLVQNLQATLQRDMVEAVEHGDKNINSLADAQDQALVALTKKLEAAVAQILQKVDSSGGVPAMRREVLRNELLRWDQLQPSSQDCLVTGDVYLHLTERESQGVEYSGAAMCYFRALEYELTAGLYQRFTSFCEKSGYEADDFDNEFNNRNGVKWFPLSRFREAIGTRPFRRHALACFGDAAQRLLDDLPVSLQRHNNLRNRAAHAQTGNLSLREARKAREDTLEIIEWILCP